MKNELAIIGCFFSFVREGTEVGSPANTVGRDYFPSADTHPEAWSGMGHVLTGTIADDGETFRDLVPGTEGPYEIDEERAVYRRSLILGMRQTNALFWELVWGLAAPVTDATPVTPDAAGDAKIRGWGMFTFRHQDGEDRMISAVYGDLRKEQDAQFSKDPTKPTLRFDMIRSPIRSLVLDNVTS